MKILNPSGWYHSPRYVSGLLARSLITTAGRVAKTLDGDVVAPGDAGAQTKHIMEALEATLSEAGATFADAVKMTTIYVDEEDWPSIVEAYSPYLTSPHPPHTAMRVQSLGSPDLRLEIEIAAAPTGNSNNMRQREENMPIQALNPSTIYNSPRYASGMRAGNILFTAGRVPLDRDGNVVAPEDASKQTEHIMRDLQEILSDGGAQLSDVVYVHTYFVASEDMPGIHEVRQRFFGDHFPPHTGTQVEKPDWKCRGIRVEIEVAAVIEEPTELTEGV